jgi:hypothetical protein
MSVVDLSVGPQKVKAYFNGPTEAVLSQNQEVYLR